MERVTVLTLVAALFLLSDQSHARDIHPSVEDTIVFAQQGSTHAHLKLARIYCGKLCFTPRADADDDSRRLLAQSLREVESLNIPPDYVKAYMHYMLADNFKTGTKGRLEMLSQHMLQTEVEMARRAAKEWEQTYYRSAK